MRSGCGSNTDLRHLDERLRPYAESFFRVLKAAGLAPTLTSVVRPPSVQACLYDRSRAGISKLPALPPGRSLHGQGLAFDLVTRPAAALARAGFLWEQVYGGEWGGRADDPVHFQMKKLSPGRPVDPWRLVKGRNISKADFDWMNQYLKPVEI